MNKNLNETLRAYAVMAKRRAEWNEKIAKQKRVLADIEAARQIECAKLTTMGRTRDAEFCSLLAGLGCGAELLAQRMRESLEEDKIVQQTIAEITG